MHVHVDIADDQEGVRVIDGLRPWLPLLVALSANSPYAAGQDTGYASWRYQMWGRWPSAGIAEPFGTVAEYERVSKALIDLGAALDPGMLYFDARLSTAYPTVEIRVADTCTEIDDALVVVAFARALVETIARESGPAEPLRSDLVRAAAWRASRHGLAGDLVDPRTWKLVDAFEALDALVAHVRPALDEARDTERVRAGLERLRATGNGARRQRAAFERSGDLRAVVTDLVARTAESARG
jgi:carboxylate-amine ligase